MIDDVPDPVPVSSSDLARSALGLHVLLFAVVVLEAAGPDTAFVRPVLTVLYLAFVPGALTVLVLRIDCSLPSFVVYALGLSLSLAMALGVILSVTLPQAGVTRPLDPLPLLLAFTALVGGLLWLVDRRPSRRLFEISLDDLWSPLPLALLLLPLLSLLGTILVDTAGESLLLLVLVGVLSLVPLGFVVWWDADRWGALSVWAVSAALVYHGGLWPFTGGHQLTQITVEQGRWIPNYADGIGSLVPNGVLYPMFALLADIPVALEWGLVNPFLVSFLPVVLFELFRRETDARTALLGCGLFVFSFPFYTLYPGGGRIATPVLFLALVGLTVVDDRLDTTVQHLLALVFVTGIAVSHYGTAWVVLAAFVASASVFYALRYSGHVTSVLSRRLAVVSSDDGPRHTSTVLSPSALAFYTVVSMAWYLYTGLGGKFSTLPNHVINGVRDILSGTAFGGGAARSATKQYGSTAIATSRLLYVLFGALMGLGIALVLWRRVVEDDRPLSDEYLALGTGFLSMLGVSFLPFSTGFNTARVMMIVFVFTAPFAVLGLAEALDRIEAVVPAVHDVSSSLRHGAPRATVAILLSVFLLLNAGVVSATVTNDYAPSNAVLQDQLRESDDPIERLRAGSCTDCVVQTHAWVFSHAGPEQPLYGDDIAVAQIDYLRGQLTDQIGTVPAGSRYQSLWSARDGTDGDSLLVVLPHNADTGGVFVGQKYNWTAYGGLEDEFRRSNRVYHGADSRVFVTRGNRSADMPTRVSATQQSTPIRKTHDRSHSLA